MYGCCRGTVAQDLTVNETALPRNQSEKIIMGTECLNTRFQGSLCLPCYVHVKVSDQTLSVEVETVMMIEICAVC